MCSVVDAALIPAAYATLSLLHALSSCLLLEVAWQQLMLQRVHHSHQLCMVVSGNAVALASSRR
jgi:hypothetical protein